MGKIKTLEKRKESKRLSFVKHEASLNKNLADRKLVREILIEALTNNDMDTFQDVLVGYIRTSSKLALSKKTKIALLHSMID